MNEISGGSYVGLLSFLSFGFSVIAAVLAIDMYALLRTGRFAQTWRVLIISSVMFALMQALRLSELLNFVGMRRYHLSEIVELMFVMSLTYAFYLQRALFSGTVRSRPTDRSDADDDNAERSDADDRADEWARLTGDYERGGPALSHRTAKPPRLHP